MTPDHFTKAGLTARGFSGWVRWAGLADASLPIEGGVYAVLCEPGSQPEFLQTSLAGFRGAKAPTVSVEILERKWVPDATVLYIGAATSLSERANAYRKQGEGRKAGHSGGRYLWQYAGWEQTVVCWKATAGDPVDVESALLSAFEAEFGRLPFANLKRGRRRPTVDSP